MKSLVEKLLPLAFCLALTCCGPSSRPADQFEEIRDTIREIVADGRPVPSIAVGVSRGSEFLWQEGFGWTDRETEIRATEHTIYHLGSTSKPITATAVMVLHEKGLIELDRPLNDYLAGDGIRGRVGDVEKVTVRRVAQHTAGLPGYYETFYADESEKPLSIPTLIQRYGWTMIPPGQTFHYSNLGYGLLGHLVSQISGSFSDFLRQEVFLPLGMEDSYGVLPPERNKNRAVRYSWPQARSDSGRLDYTTPHHGASELQSSVHDLLKFALFHMQIPVAGQKPILSSDAIGEMQASTVPMGEDEYGIGWHITTDTAGRHIVKHGGGGAGVDVVLTFVPEEKVAVAVLSNTTNGWPNEIITQQLTNRILSIVFESDTRVSDTREPSDESRGEREPLPEHILGTWDGRVSAPGREVPLRVQFKGSGPVKAELNGESTPVTKLRFQNDRLTAEMRADIGTPDANRRRHHLKWDVSVHEGRLAGILYVEGENPSRGVLLPYWVELTRE